MIILSNSIPKTGSTLLANYQEDILNKSSKKSGQHKIISNYGGRYIEHPTKKDLINFFLIDLLHGSFVIKCHWNYDKLMDIYCHLPNVKITMTYRDPRDMILSMIDHGERTRQGKDSSGAFADCYTVNDMIPRTVQFMENLKVWNKKSGVHLIRYEDLVSQPFDVLKRMNLFFNLALDEGVLKGIIDFRNDIKSESHNFNKGTTERWRTEMNKEEKEACLNSFEQYLRWLNYDLK
ncbi:sulfotransferase domain-containing protein [Mangrovimonas sp. AS39]|uniref:sulfotransferase domain-containing protein n=1 Tax=Mangrovimonas futianensis TaxID=2895523 RepID=UPI001E54B2B6|nr:sulfotransferase domain-containing protein [Mangrovimonas futianensis]MCF1190808.1 sulfotransferase domain-containing protein [Mangrovimonas futianensis]MCF1194505.1 sulfotransferase domain-containing protein [Mangrovimonas futianensis]